MSGLTKDQVFATNPDLSLWVGASAGTGKTHVLTARVLRMMIRGTTPDHILGLTYTKAAAAEMAARVYKTLGKWAVAREQELAAEIFKSTGEQAGDEALDRARTLFATVLDIPGGLKIQTIHSFCQSLLKRFPLEAGLPPNFTVMEERTSAEFLKEAMDQVMLAATDGGIRSLKRAFDHIAEKEAETGFEGLVNAVLGKRRQVLRLVQIYSGEEGLISAIHAALGVDRKQTRENIIGEAFRKDAFDKEGLEKLTRIILTGSPQEQKIAENLKPFFAGPEGHETYFEGYCSAFFTTSGDPRKSFFVKATLEQHPELPEIFTAEQQRLIAVKEKLSLLQVASDTAALIHLSNAVLGHYQAAKEAHGFLDYDDLILKTSDLLAREGIAPWILYKLDGGIDHILVDEAQDTNQVQWQLVEVLSDEFFSGLGGREGVLRTVFAVGDIKQSIFRFQGAEPKEFELAKVRIRRKAEDADLALKDCLLNLSFRSTEAVLRAVDTVFTHEQARSGIAGRDEVVAHEAHRLGHAGLVEVWPPERPQQKPEAPSGWRLPDRQKFSNKPAARLAEKIASHIEAMINTGEQLESRDRPVRYGDFLVLVKTRDAFMDHIIRELKTRNIPVAGSDRMVLSQQLAIQDLIALARFVLLPEDDFTLACVLKGPLLNLTDEDLLELAPKRTGTLWRALANAAKTKAGFKAGVKFLTGLLGAADFITPYDFFSQVLGSKGGRKLFVRRLGAEVNDPLDEFLSLTLEYEQNHTPSLQGFLKWFQSGQTQIKRDMERGKNEVRIMTIHGAKGLQAPIVYLPDTFKVPRKRRDDLLTIPPQLSAPGRLEPLLVWLRNKEMQVGPCKLAAEKFLEEERAEHNRLLYVALTRAEDRLYISGWMAKSVPKDPTWYGCIRESLEALAEVEKIATGDDLPLLRLENPQTREPQPDQEKIAPRPEAISLPTWIYTPVRDEPGFTGVVQPSRVLETPFRFGGGDEKGPAKGILKGNLVHKLLEILPDIDPEKREKTARAYLAQKIHGLTGPEADEIWVEVKRVLEHPDFKEIFGPGSRAEAELLGSIEGKPLLRRIDRLVVKKDQVLIVDYKSDLEVPNNPKEVSESYLVQLGEYRTLVRSLFKGHKIRTALLWTQTCTLMEIPE